jgi:hypothetical protein
LGFDISDSSQASEGVVREFKSLSLRPNNS